MKILLSRRQPTDIKLSATNVAFTRIIVSLRSFIVEIEEKSKTKKPVQWEYLAYSSDP